MAHERDKEHSRNPLRRAASAITSVVSRLTHRGQGVEHAEEPVTRSAAPASSTAPRAETASQSRGARRQADIPMDTLANTHTVQQTSVKTSFRSDGNDRHRDQEFARGVSDDERWNDEDRITNKSGDPRIGTHGRTYEPGESRAENRE
jgi:hypothetical protein